ncbi:Conjugal transfer protein TraD [Fulvimarina manganoxydans]|uniref:Conjugal transfer protein TraD n=1 Tax=Fulvimarina manganoxydans TaxID=937218 RepID=A0A1W2C0D2_9HYPH|nr:conjugal transfer protein TraD [Fulvimarina manganoxydans]MCK5934051.1 conjugal transfer protein TraD [Fulvimarina manganoxydans]SMC78464.1 Conjugal transfer protein TraD [Fulvimarina manganoxydans]
MTELKRTSDARSRRAAETRHKIELGGLVVKAGLGDADKAFILGLLIEGLEQSADPETKTRMRFRGQRAFNASSS